MFEKEAEEYIDKLTRDWSDGEYSFSVEELRQAILHFAEYGFQKGIKTKINTTTISDCPIKDEWHKPSEKLPEECSLVLAYLFEETEPTICEYVVSNQWEFLPKRIVFCSNDKVRLWQEIVLPKESE